MSRLTYQDAGVDPEKAAKTISDFVGFLRSRPRDPNILTGIGPYASCYSLGSWLKNYPDPVLVTCCDGVGTKLKLALDWGDLSHIGTDLVAMNVNDLLCVGADPILFLDYYATGHLESGPLTTILKSIQLACEQSGCSLVGGETAELPGLYHGADFDLAGFAVGLVSRENILSPERIAVGDVVLAVASSGLHSNGFSLVRKLVNNIDPNDRTPFGKGTWRETLLQPTILYTKPFQALKNSVGGLAHITGGGLFENLPRILPEGVAARISSKQWPFPPLFQWLQDRAGMTTSQMLSTFNCGVGMIAVASASAASKIQEHLHSQRLSCWQIGKIEKASDDEGKVTWI